MRDDSDRLWSCPFCDGDAELSCIEDESSPDHGDDPVPLLIERWNRRSRVTRAMPLAEYNDDFGAVLWWCFPVNEPPYVGQPSDDDWPGYHTHWTPIDVPAEEGVTC